MITSNNRHTDRQKQQQQQMMIRGDQELLLTQEQTNGLTVELSCVGYKKKANSYTYHSRLFCLIKAYYSTHSRSSFSCKLILSLSLPLSTDFLGFLFIIAKLLAPFLQCSSSHYHQHHQHPLHYPGWWVALSVAPSCRRCTNYESICLHFSHSYFIIFPPHHSALIARDKLPLKAWD